MFRLSQEEEGLMSRGAVLTRRATFAKMTMSI